MNGEFCLNCEKMRIELLETIQGSRKTPPYRMVFLRVWCNGGVLASERVGMPEFLGGDFVFSCRPYTNVISKGDLSPQMAEDYDGAIKRACEKISCFGSDFIPQGCNYAFEHEMSEICRE